MPDQSAPDNTVLRLMAVIAFVVAAVLLALGLQAGPDGAGPAPDTLVGAVLAAMGGVLLMAHADDRVLRAGAPAGRR